METNPSVRQSGNNSALPKTRIRVEASAPTLYFPFPETICQYGLGPPIKIGFCTKYFPQAVSTWPKELVQTQEVTLFEKRNPSAVLVNLIGYTSYWRLQNEGGGEDIWRNNPFYRISNE